MHCTACQHPVDDPEALFCPACGARIERDDLCPACAKPYLPDARFCVRCGAERGGAAASAPTEPLYCDGSGEVILPADRHFLCPVCDGHFLERFRGNERGVCQDCLTHPVEPEETQPAAAQPEAPQPPLPGPSPAPEILPGIPEHQWARIPAGDFQMGSPEKELYRFDNEHRHLVVLDGFEMLRTPVTFAQYDAYCRSEGLDLPSDEGWGRGDRPVINVTYWSAAEYCQWLSRRAGCTIRLPTEAEWEYACRAGSSTPFWTGPRVNPDQANFDACYSYNDSPKGEARGRTTPVDQFPANPWGLHDMHGNVWEWCASVFDEGYSGLERLDASRNRDDSRERALRGGSWANVPGGIRAAIRNKLNPNLHFFKVGFRIVRAGPGG